MKLVIFGATGTLEKFVLEAALAEQHQITMLARSPYKISAFADRISIIAGDYFDENARTQALVGAEAVLSTLGPPMRRSPNNGEYAKAMIELIDQTQTAGIDRIVAVGGAGLRLGNERLALPRRIIRLMLRVMGGKGHWDKEHEHNALHASRLNWTILHPPQIARASGQLVVTQDGPAAFKADPAQLAHQMLASLTDAATVRTAPFVATK
ncbi:MAG: NAD(P)H-binding protein [Pseudomonadota bacterium]